MRLKTLLIIAFAWLCATQAQADWPKKPIELIVPYQPGGGTDLLARSFATAAKEHLNKPIGVVNKPGGSGAIGFSLVASSKPDGYKMGVGTIEMVLLPSLGMLNYLPKDFTPIARLNSDPAAVTVSADSPFNSLDELLSYAKENPGKLRVGNSGTGAIWHLAAAALEDKTGAKFVHVPFEGAAPAVTSLLGGHIELVTVSPAEVSAQVKNGKLKILAIMSKTRGSGYLAEVPTLKELGVDLSFGTWRGLIYPANAPAEALAKMQEVAAKVAKEPSFIDALDKLNLNLDYASGEEFWSDIEQQREYFALLFEKLGLKK